MSIELPNPCYRVSSWGSPQRSGNRFFANAETQVLVGGICIQIGISASHDYDLGELEPGDYEFAFSILRQPARTFPFTVGPISPYVPNPEAVSLRQGPFGTNHLMAVSVTLPSACEFVRDWGVPILEGKQIRLDSRIYTRARPEVGCLTVITEPANDYLLPQLDAGQYEVVFSVFGSPIRTFSLTVPEPTTDADGDGVSDWDEYLADTNPSDPNSVLRMVGIERTPQGLRLKWRGGQRATLVVQQASSLEPDDIRWQDIHTNTPPTEAEPTTLIRATSADRGFFRVQVRR